MREETKKENKWLAMVTATVWAFTGMPLTGNPVYAAEQPAVESATGFPTDAVQNATPLPLNGDWVSDSVDEKEVDYFSVDLTKAGYLTIYYNGNTLKKAELILYSSEFEQYDSKDDYRNEALNQETYWLNAGRYYISVKGNNYIGSYSIKSAFKEAGNTDTTYHNSFESASALSVNQKVIGFLSMYESDIDRIDYYKFTVPETGEYVFNLTSNDSTNIYAELYDSERVENEEFSLNANRPYAAQEKIILEKGEEYFLRIYGFNYPHTLVGKYTFSFKKADVLAESIKITPARKTVTVGQSLDLSSKIFPETTTKQNVLWKSQNQVLAVVKEGNVTTRKPGIVTITAQTLDGSEKTATATITIKPKQTAAPKLKTAKGKLTASWKSQNGVDGYQVQYATDKAFKKKKTVSVTTTKTTISKLSKKNYYVRVRAFVTVETDGSQKIVGDWSKAVKGNVK
ncbi:MAG: Ig-like domain-containing protein [Lachnospiraceae bacterium]